MGNYYEYWTDTKNGAKCSKLYITSSYETNCKRFGRPTKAFICRMSNGMTFFSCVDYSAAFLTWHMVRKGTELEDVREVDIVNVRDNFKSLEELKSAILD